MHLCEQNINKSLIYTSDNSTYSPTQHENSVPSMLSYRALTVYIYIYIYIYILFINRYELCNMIILPKRYIISYNEIFLIYDFLIIRLFYGKNCIIPTHIFKNVLIYIYICIYME